MSKNDSDLKELKEAIEHLHNCRASYLETVSIIERFGQETVWQGQVHSFQIEGHPKASLCFAWASPIKDSAKTKAYAVLCVPPIDSPEKAVRASIVSDQRTKAV